MAKKRAESKGSVSGKGKKRTEVITPTPVAGASAACFFQKVVEAETYHEDAYSGTFVATAHTSSPWSDQHQHAGPAAALMVRAVERLHVPTPAAITNQVSIDILEALPVGAIAVTAQVVHGGHYASLVEAEITYPGYTHPVMRMSAWRSRRADIGVPGRAGNYRQPPNDGEKAKSPKSWTGGYTRAIRWRVTEGSLSGGGRTTVWAKPAVTLVDDEPATGIPLVMLVADAAAGLSALANPAHHVFVNTDLNVHAVREPVGRSMWITAESFLDPDGIGLASATLGDKRGSLAVANQALFLAPRHEVKL